MYICIYICMCICVYAWICVCVYVSVCIYVYYIYIYIYIYTRTSGFRREHRLVRILGKSINLRNIRCKLRFLAGNIVYKRWDFPANHGLMTIQDKRILSDSPPKPTWRSKANGPNEWNLQKGPIFFWHVFLDRPGFCPSHSGYLHFLSPSPCEFLLYFCTVTSKRFKGLGSTATHV